MNQGGLCQKGRVLHRFPGAVLAHPAWNRVFGYTENSTGIGS